jgi:predicted O-methyltransferase YrrM
MTEVMICRSAAYAKYDARGPGPAKILAMGPVSEPAGGGSGLPVAEYFRALADPGYWSEVDRLTLGKSMHPWQPPALLRSLLRAGEIAAGRSLGTAGEVGQSATAPRIERAVASWLVATSGDVREDPKGLVELTYLAVSGGYRSAALRKVLRTLAPAKRFANITDIGAGVGFVPLLLAAGEPSVGLRSVCLVEPYERYLGWGRQLWSEAAQPPLTFEFQHNSAETAVLAGGRDLIFFGQCFYLIGESRRTDVLARVSEALDTGGYVIVNEAARSDPAKPDAHWDDRYPDCITLPRLVEQLSAIGSVSLLRQRSDWQEMEDPLSLSAVEIGLDSFYVVTRR